LNCFRLVAQPAGWGFFRAGLALPLPVDLWMN
jgi:hypothetical protein